MNIGLFFFAKKYHNAHFVLDKNSRPWGEKALYPSHKKIKGAHLDSFIFSGGEREGFDPPEPLSSTVFKTAAIDHSAISPKIGCKGTTFFFKFQKKFAYIKKKL